MIAGAYQGTRSTPSGSRSLRVAMATGKIGDMPRKVPDEDCLPVIVPRNEKGLTRVSPDRIRRLREHLIEALHDLHGAKQIDRAASPISPEPSGFPAVVARTACSLCRGFCCRNGDDNAFLDYRTMARLWMADPTRGDAEIVKLYLDRVPAFSYRDSCIFHGKRGCTLDRSMRADVCNTYFCGGLANYIKTSEVEEPTIVIAGDAHTMRVSRVLTPCS
jgi:hypothetical protein